MDTKELKSFVIAAKNGSFQKAAEQLFLSSTALIKQINGLEDELGFKLFVRTNKGIILTESGKVFYDASEDILMRCAEAVQSARDRSAQKVEPIRLGFSPINPYQNVFDSYYYREEHFNGRFSNTMVPISGEFKDFMDEMRNLGSHVDLIPYFFGNTLMEPLCKKFCLARIPMRIALAINHPLANKDMIRFDDLNGQELVTLADSVNSYYKIFNEKIQNAAPHVRFCPVSFIDFFTLNETVIGRRLLLVGGYLRDVHPLLKFLPLEGDMLLPYGLYYSSDPTPGVEEFLQAFRDTGISGEIEDTPVVSFQKE